MDSPPASPFGRPWDQLRLEDLSTFFSREAVERAIWEGKGAAPKGELATFVRKECCGFANHRGGYLVLGVDEIGSRRWTVSGVDLPTIKELHDWVANLLRDLEPDPTFDTQEWGLPNGRRLAVVQVSPQAIPPVAWAGKVYKRSGSQTRSLSGSEIAQLARRGEKVRRATERRAEKAAAECAKTIFAPFGIAVANTSGERTHIVADRTPEHILYAALKRRLEARWSKRKLTPMVFDAKTRWDELEEMLLVESDGGPGFSGWRAAWEVEQEGGIKLGGRRRNLGGPTPKLDSSLTDRDVWLAKLTPDGVGSALFWPLPVRRTRMDLEFGERAISHAGLLLRVLLQAEARLGAPRYEQLAVSFVLNRWGTGEKPVKIASWVAIGDDPRDWQQFAKAEAERRTVLIPGP